MNRWKNRFDRSLTIEKEKRVDSVKRGRDTKGWRRYISMGAFSRRGREEGHVVGTRGKRANTRGCRQPRRLLRGAQLNFALVPPVLASIYSVRVHGNAIEAYYRRGFSFICKLSEWKLDRELSPQLPDYSLSTARFGNTDNTSVIKNHEGKYFFNLISLINVNRVYNNRVYRSFYQERKKFITNLIWKFWILMELHAVHNFFFFFSFFQWKIPFRVHEISIIFLNTIFSSGNKFYNRIIRELERAFY